MIPRTLALSLLSTLAIGGTLAAQGVSIYVPDNMPGVGTNNVIPFGNTKSSATWKNQKYQMLINGSYVNNKPITIRDLGFAPGSSNLHNIDHLIVRVGLTTATTLSATFATNIAIRPATLLDVKNFTWYLKKDQWTRIGLQAPYTWIPTLGNLVVDIECHGSGGLGTTSTSGFHRSTTIERKYAIGWTSTPPATGNSGTSLAATKIELVVSNGDASPFGLGCVGSNGTPALTYTGTPTINNTLVTNLSSAKANSAAVTIFGLTNINIDLTNAGASGCVLNSTLDFATGVQTGNGSASVSVPIPNNTAFVGAVYYNQFFVLDPSANNLGLVGSNFGRVLVGL